MEEVLQEWLAKAKKRIEDDEKLREELKDYDGIFQLDITDSDCYYVEIKAGEVGDLTKGVADNARLTVTSDVETMKAIMSGEMGAMKAFALKKIKLRGSFEDIIKLRKFLKPD